MSLSTDSNDSAAPAASTASNPEVKKNEQYHIDVTKWRASCREPTKETTHPLELSYLLADANNLSFCDVTERCNASCTRWCFVNKILPQEELQKLWLGAAQRKYTINTFIECFNIISRTVYEITFPSLVHFDQVVEMIDVTPSYVVGTIPYGEYTLSSHFPYSVSYQYQH